MRTLHVDTGREMRGGQWQVLYLLERMEDSVLLARRGSALFHEAQKRGLEVREASLRSIREHAKDAKLIHAHDARAHLLAAVAAGGKPLVVSRRVAFPLKRGFFSSWKYSQGEVFLAVSKFVAGELIKGGVRPAKIRVVYDGVPVPEPARPQPGRVIALASKPIVLPGVHLTADLWQDLSTAAVFAYPSRLEGLGSAALAAMASGVPVVASAVGGLPEIVEHERTGLLVRDDDFATPVRRLLDDPGWAARLGHAGRERAMEKFSLRHMVENTVKAYRELISKEEAGC